MYDFRTLSPLDFEELVRDLLQAEFSIRMESFGSGRDLGIDFRFATGMGKAIVQAKHFVESGAEALIRAARLEDEKVVRLSPRRYLLATSVSLTPQLKTRLRQALPNAPLDEADIFGRSDLNNLLGRHPKVERKHFKLWLASTPVLERILHSGVYNRTQAEMDVIKSMIPKFVQYEGVSAAENILAKTGALIIAGEPGVGKSTLARILVWLHAEQNWQISVIDDIKEAFEIVGEEEKKLIFFDDFLGQVRLSTDLVRSVDQRLPPFLQKVRSNKNLRFIMTTRDYILRQAQSFSSRLSSAAVSISEFTLNVGHYTRGARAQILYNHLYFSEISQEEKEALLVDDFFLKVIDHPNYNPRLIDLLTSADYLSVSPLPIRSAVEAVLQNPEELWEKPYRSHITQEGRALMMSLFFNDPRTLIPALERSFVRMVDAMGFDIPRADRSAKFRLALKELEGSVLAIQDRQVRFSNPGVRDFLRRTILLDKFLPTAVSAASEYAEVSRCWRFFLEQKEQALSVRVNGDEWSLAVERMLADAGDPAIQLLDLVIDMYDELQTDRALDHVGLVIELLDTSEVEGREADTCPDILEKVARCSLPQEELSSAKRVLSRAVEKMLTVYGASLTLEEIRTVGDSLFEYGDDEGASLQAMRAALSSYIDEIDDALTDMHALEELEDFEGELKGIMGTYGLDDRRVDRQIDRRRQRLLEKLEDDDSERRYGRSSSPSLRQISDDEIRSMFRIFKPK